MTSTDKRHYPGGSKGRVNRAGANFRRGEETEEDTRILEEWRKAHGHVLDAFWKLLKRRTRDTEVILAQRHKRRYTIIDKLRRPGKLGGPTVRNLAEMNDVAGCRLVFEDIEALYGFRENFHKAKFKHRLKHDVDRYDYVKRPKDDGYRGVHDVYSYVSGSRAGKRYGGLLVEIQYRTRVQHAWATAVEILDNDLKFGRGDGNLSEIFRLASEMLARVFEARRSCLSGCGDEEIVERFDKLNSEIGFTPGLDKLERNDEEISERGEVILELGEDGLRMESFRDSAGETFDSLFDRERREPDKNIVLVKADEAKDIRFAFRNYFSDASEFTEKIRLGRDMLPRDSGSHGGSNLEARRADDG